MVKNREEVNILILEKMKGDVLKSTIGDVLIVNQIKSLKQN